MFVCINMYTCNSYKVNLCGFQGCMSCNPTALGGSDAAAHSPSLATPDSSSAQDCLTSDT